MDRPKRVVKLTELAELEETVLSNENDLKIKHHDLIINQSNPFENCKLGRQQYAEVLTDIINAYKDGFVLSINNEWGSGKTTFVKMWQQYLENEKFKTIYFNSWENDFDNNPLIAIMSELKSLINTDNKTAFNSIIQKGAILIKNIAPTLVKSLVKKYAVDIDEIALDTIEDTTKGVTEILKEEIDAYTKKKKTIIEFRKELEVFIKRNTDKPLIFIIDELDRCRPDYAVEVLEQMKHFFAVPGIIFILSIDKNHLASSIKGYYGSENINTDEYLRRFIDLEYSISKPITEHYVDYLFHYYSFNTFFSKSRKEHREFKTEERDFLIMSTFLMKKSNATLRQQEKIFAHTRLILCSIKENQFAFPVLLFVLTYLKSMRLDEYRKIQNNLVSLQELSDIFTSLFLDIDNEELNVGYIEAELLTFYNNNKTFKETLVHKDEKGNITTPIKSKLGFNNPNYIMDEYLMTVKRQSYRSFKLEILLQKIDLIHPILK